MRCGWSLGERGYGVVGLRQSMLEIMCLKQPRKICKKYIALSVGLLSGLNKYVKNFNGI